MNRGTARVSLGDHSGALEDFTKAVTLQPGSVKALINRGFVKIIMGDPNGALADCNRALEFAADIREGRCGAADRSGSGWETGLKAARI